MHSGQYLVRMLLSTYQVRMIIVKRVDNTLGEVFNAILSITLMLSVAVIKTGGDCEMASCESSSIFSVVTLKIETKAI